MSDDQETERLSQEINRQLAERLESDTVGTYSNVTVAAVFSEIKVMFAQCDPDAKVHGPRVVGNALHFDIELQMPIVTYSWTLPEVDLDPKHPTLDECLAAKYMEPGDDPYYRQWCNLQNLAAAQTVGGVLIPGTYGIPGQSAIPAAHSPAPAASQTYLWYPDVVVANCDNVPDTSGEAFAPNALTWVNSSVPLTLNGTRIGEAQLQFQPAGDRVLATLHIYDPSVTSSLADQMRPCVRGAILSKNGNTTLRARIHSIELSLKNADSRIGTLWAQTSRNRIAPTIQARVVSAASKNSSDLVHDLLSVGLDCRCLRCDATWALADMAMGMDLGACPGKPKATAKPGCKNCRLELSSTLDAYHGRNPRGAEHCEPCRRKLKIT